MHAAINIQRHPSLRFDSGYLIKEVGGRKGTEHTLPLGYYHSWLVVKTIPCLRVSDVPYNLMIESWIFVLENSCDCWDTRCQMVLGNVACAHCVPIPSPPSFLLRHPRSSVRLDLGPAGWGEEKVSFDLIFNGRKRSHLFWKTASPSLDHFTLECLPLFPF